MNSDAIKTLHAAYCRMTGLTVSLNLVSDWRMRVWFDWANNGWGEPELELVVRYVKRCIKYGDRGFNIGTLRFNTLIGQPDRFEELLAEARQAMRVKQPDPGLASVLRASGRECVAETNTARSAGIVAAEITRDPEAARKAAQAFFDLRKIL